jgi:hypothetical protein
MDLSDGKSFERGLYPAVGIVIVQPVDRICERRLVTELAYVVDPTGVGSGLDIGLGVPPIGALPDVVDDARKRVPQVVTGAIDHDVIVETLSSASFYNRDHPKTITKARMSFAEHPPVQHIEEVVEVLGCFVSIEECGDAPQSVIVLYRLLHRQGDCERGIPMIDQREVSERSLETGWVRRIVGVGQSQRWFRSSIKTGWRQLFIFSRRASGR